MTAQPRSSFRRALCMAENATRSLHNLLMLRTLVRDPRVWSRCSRGTGGQTPQTGPDLGLSLLERVTGIEPALSAWELACHALPTTVFAVQILFALSVSARC
jgi:hypothetical protein